MSEVVRHFKDIDFTVVAKTNGEYSVDFTVYEISGYSEGEMPGEFDVPCYSKEPESGFGYMEDTEDLSEVAPYLSGFVKWDGCSNWRFDKQDQVMLHFCSREQLEAIGKLMAACWDMTAELCPKWMP